MDGPMVDRIDFYALKVLSKELKGEVQSKQKGGIYLIFFRSFKELFKMRTLPRSFFTSMIPSISFPWWVKNCISQQCRIFFHFHNSIKVNHGSEKVPGLLQSANTILNLTWKWKKTLHCRKTQFLTQRGSKKTVIMEVKNNLCTVLIWNNSLKLTLNQLATMQNCLKPPVLK